MGNAIYQAITNAMADISPIAKGKRNKEQGFQYRGVDDVMNELSPILSKHKIFIYPEVIDKQRHERQTKSGSTLLYSILTVKHHFVTDDGSEVCTTVVGEGMDSGDKASNKAMAVAFKYACLQMFCIPTEDMSDPDNTTPPPSTPKKSEPQKTNELSGQQITDEIGKVLNTESPDGEKYITRGIIDVYREETKAANKKKDLEQLKQLLSDAKDELETAKKNYTSVPFDNNVPDMYKEKEPEFIDDIPF